MFALKNMQLHWRQDTWSLHLQDRTQTFRPKPIPPYFSVLSVTITFLPKTEITRKVHLFPMYLNICKEMNSKYTHCAKQLMYNAVSQGSPCNTGIGPVTTVYRVFSFLPDYFSSHLFQFSSLHDVGPCTFFSGT